MSPIPARTPMPATAFDQAQEERLLAAYEEYINNVAVKAWKAYGRIYRMDEDDFRQEGRLALILAIRGLDWDKYSSRQIDRFLRIRIRGAMIDFTRCLDPNRSTCWRKYKEPVMVELGTKEDIGGYISTLSSPGYPVDSMLDAVAAINGVLSTIEKERERRMVLMAIQGHDNVAIALAVDRTPSRVSQVLTASGLFSYKEVDSGGKRKRIKDGVSKTTEWKRRKKLKDNDFVFEEKKVT